MMDSPEELNCQYLYSYLVSDNRLTPKAHRRHGDSIRRIHVRVEIDSIGYSRGLEIRR